MERNDIIQQLSDHLFWDVKRQEIEPTKHKRYIIIRTMDRGTSQDVRLVWDYYGAETIKDELLHAPSLHLKTISFFANQFHIPPEDFRAYHKNKELQTWDQ